MRRLEATVYGHVQGVSFRYYAQMAARRLQATGWVRNEPDGSVRLVAEGEEARLQELLRFLHEGSPMARVNEVKSRWAEATGEFAHFQVRL